MVVNKQIKIKNDMEIFGEFTLSHIRTTSDGENNNCLRHFMEISSVHSDVAILAVFILYNNREIYIVDLKPTLSLPSISSLCTLIYFNTKRIIRFINDNLNEIKKNE